MFDFDFESLDLSAEARQGVMLLLNLLEELKSENSALQAKRNSFVMRLIDSKESKLNPISNLIGKRRRTQNQKLSQLLKS